MSRANKKANLFLLLTLLCGVSFIAIWKPHRIQISNSKLERSTVHAQSSNCDDPIYKNWPQVAHDAQRTGKAPEDLGLPGIGYDKDNNDRIEYSANNQTINDVAWRYAFQPDKIFPQVQAIVYCNKVFVGTEGANGKSPSVYVFNAQTGQQESWSPKTVGGSILSSAAAGGGKVYVAAMDGKVYAFDAQTGANVSGWPKQIIPVTDGRGFSTAPLLADGKIMLGGRNGIFYAIDANNGNILWQKNIGAPILQTAAANNGKVFFGAMDMYVYALNTLNGIEVWSTQVAGMAMKDYWPVVHQGRIYVYPILNARVDASSTELANCSAVGATCDITLQILNETTGALLPSIPHANFPLMNGAMTPPCVFDNNNLVLSADDSWSKVNVSTGLVSKFEAGGLHGYFNTDENMNVSCAQNAVIAIHHNGSASCGSGGAGFSGVFNISDPTTNPVTGQWICYVVPRASDEMLNNSQGGGGNPASIANGIFYHITNHGINAVKTK